VAKRRVQEAVKCGSPLYLIRLETLLQLAAPLQPHCPPSASPPDWTYQATHLSLGPWEMATPASLLVRHEAITAQYHEHATTVQDIQQQAITDLLPVLEQELEWNDEIKGRARAFVEDAGESQLSRCRATELQTLITGSTLNSHRLPLLASCSILPLGRSQALARDSHLPLSFTYINWSFPLHFVDRNRLIPLSKLSTLLLPPFLARQVRPALRRSQSEGGEEDRGWSIERAEGFRAVGMGDGEEVVE
jgi:hypothetical protein